MTPDKEKEIEDILKSMSDDHEKADQYFASGQMDLDKQLIFGVLNELASDTTARRKIIKEFVNRLTFIMSAPVECIRKIIDAELKYDAGQDFEELRRLAGLNLPPKILRQTKKVVARDRDNQADYVGVLKAFLFVRPYLFAALMESGVTERFKSRLRKTDEENNT